MASAEVEFVGQDKPPRQYYGATGVQARNKLDALLPPKAELVILVTQRAGSGEVDPKTNTADQAFEIIRSTGGAVRETLHQF